MNSAESTIGRRLRQFRWICGVSQADVAQHLCVSPKQISGSEVGTTRLAAAQMPQIANFLNIPAPTFSEGMRAAPNAATRAKRKAQFDPTGMPLQDAKVMAIETERERSG